MTAKILDGRSLAKRMQADVQKDVELFVGTQGVSPCLVVVQVEGDSASERYVRGIRKACEKVGITFSLEQFPADVSQQHLNTAMERLSSDSAVHGVLLQIPLPAHLSAEETILHLDHTKDVDGIHPINAGLLAQGRQAIVPNTPAGGMLLLERNGINLEGKRVAMVGRSAIVGRPMVALMLQANATITICHTRTRDMGSVLRECDVVVVAAGRARLVTADMVRPGAVVVDFGINVLDDGSMVGDVDFEPVAEIASAITPVPGGTGPMTNVMLMQQVLKAAQQQTGSV